MSVGTTKIYVVQIQEVDYQILEKGKVIIIEVE